MSEATETGTPALNIEKCLVVLLDVAGTTTSINFVKETLFPYVLKEAEGFLKDQWEDEAVKEAVKLLKDTELDLEGATAAVKELTQENNDNKGLKTIQGLIYKKGYQDGNLKAHVFSDVPASLEAWAKSRKVAIYSTGSVESQQLLFSHTTEGDISAHITKYFDQSVGTKTESESYKNIAKALEVKTEEIIFVTDSPKEAEAAKSAGVLPVLIKRAENEDIPKDAANIFPVVSDFKEIVFENSGKRKNVEEIAQSEEQPPSKIAKTDTAIEKAAAAESVVAVPQEDEKMEVDTPAEQKVDSSEDKSEDKPSEPECKTKTDADSGDNKTEEASVPEKTQPEKTEETQESPMKTVTESVDPEKKVEEKSEKLPEETEEKKEETATEKENPKEEVEKEAETTSVDKTEEKGTDVEKMEAEDSSENNEQTAKTTDIKGDTPATETKKDEVKVEVTETKAETKEESKNEETSEVVKVEENNEKKPVSESNEVEMKEDSVREKKADEIVEDKADDNKTKETVKQVEENVTNEENTEKKDVAEDQIKSVENNAEESKTAEKETHGDAEEKVESTASCKTEEKSETSETCSKEETVEPSSSEGETKTEVSKDEKENKSELANGVENGDAEKSEVVNGDTEEKHNGDAETSQSDSKVEDIKVKKIEETQESTPAVSVEV